MGTFIRLDGYLTWPATRMNNLGALLLSHQILQRVTNLSHEQNNYLIVTINFQTVK